MHEQQIQKRQLHFLNKKYLHQEHNNCNKDRKPMHSLQIIPQIVISLVIHPRIRHKHQKDHIHNL